LYVGLRKRVNINRKIVYVGWEDFGAAKF